VAEYTEEQQQANTYYRIQYYPNGTISGEGLMTHGIRNGIWKYYDEARNKIAEDVLDNGKQVEYVKCWYPTGEMERKLIELKNREGHWLAEDYYRNKNLKVQTYLINREIPDSTFIKYYPSGQIKEKGHLDEGKKIGEWIYYDSMGTEIEKTTEPGTNHIGFEE
ncbi:MAG: hypothetical protein AAGI38_11260, partial [Bacteroidota bacterium]